MLLLPEKLRYRNRNVNLRKNRAGHVVEGRASRGQEQWQVGEHGWGRQRRQKSMSLPSRARPQATRKLEPPPGPLHPEEATAAIKAIGENLHQATADNLQRPCGTQCTYEILPPSW